jgi:hypothetical protein
VANISRNSFQETQNVLNDLRDLVPAPQQSPRHYVSLRIQQGVPVLDADLNELEDIRRIELETLLVNTIGNGVPVGSDGFRVQEAADSSRNFSIEAGLILVDGWLVYNPQPVDYVLQPYRNAGGVSPPLPVPLPNATEARRELAYLDAWEREVDSRKHPQLADPRIGIETAVRLERIWVVRMEPIGAEADPQDPQTIPNRQAGHRYYPLATVDRPAGSQITATMMTDLRRTHLTLDALTYAPLNIYDPARDQRLDSTRLADSFHYILRALGLVLTHKPNVLVFIGNEIETWQAMTAFNDVRATATTFEHQARRELLHQQAALMAMKAFCNVQMRLVDVLQEFVDANVASSGTESFLADCNEHLKGTGPNDPTSLEYALAEDDLLGAVLAQERLNFELLSYFDDLPEGSVSVSLIAITPTGPLEHDREYLLTIRIFSGLSSDLGSELIRVTASAGNDWDLTFEFSDEADKREVVADVPNGETFDVVLRIVAAENAPDTVLSLSVRPERRQQRVNYRSLDLALGEDPLGGGDAIAALTYEGPSLPGEIPRSVMLAGRSLPFHITNLSEETERFQMTIQPESAGSGWAAPEVDKPIQTLEAGQTKTAFVRFAITSESAAIERTYLLWLIRVTGGANETLDYTEVELTFRLEEES